MSARRGVLSAGSFCVDFNKSIARWPEQDTVTEVVRIDRQGGGAGYNMAIDLKRLDPAFPVEAMGVIGADDLGRFLIGECEARGVACDGLKALPDGATMSVDAINVLDTGRRTHFFHAGVAAAMSPAHFDFSSTRARILHLGLPGAHAAMDAAWRADANGWVAVLKAARSAGLQTNLEMMTTSAERLAELGRPCLPHLDYAHRQRLRDRRARGRRHAARRRFDRCRLRSVAPLPKPWKSARCAGSSRISRRAPSPAAATGHRRASARSRRRAARSPASTGRVTPSPPG